MIKMEINGKIELLRDKWDFARQVEQYMGREAAEYLLSFTEVDEDDIQEIFDNTVENIKWEFEREFRYYLKSQREN